MTIREPAPSPGDDQRRLAEISDILRNDRHRYDKENLGDEAQDIRNRLGAEAGKSVQPPPADAPGRASRVDEIKTMMREQPHAYTRSAAIQQEYRDLIAQPTDQPTGGAPSASDSPSAFPADNQGNQ